MKKFRCDWCGKNINISKTAQITYKHHFCSRKCKGTWQSKNCFGERHHSWRGGKIKKICDFCGKVFFVSRYLFKKNKNFFCSVECSAKWQSKYKSGKNSNRWNGGAKHKAICGYCNKTIMLPTWRYKRKNIMFFCDRKCYMKYHKKYSIIKTKYKYPNEFSVELKSFIRKRDNYMCMNCGLSEKEYFRKLDIHHIDYRKKNNDTINLIAICTSCNAKANINRKYWQKHYEQLQIDRKVHILDMKTEMNEKIDFDELLKGA